MIQDQLYINGKLYTVENIDEVPSDLRYGNNHTKTVNNVTLFFTRGSIYSNFHDAPFKDTFSDTDYTCTEQFIQSEKARLFKDTVSHAKIMETKDPVDMKNFGKRIKGFNDHVWAENRAIIAKKGVFLKFEQNPQLQTALLATTGLFAECNPSDPVFGIGLPMTHKDASNPLKWKDDCNLMGAILVEVREEILELAKQTEDYA